MPALTLTQAMSCRRCPGNLNISDERSGMQNLSGNPEPLFHVVAVNRNSGRKTVVSNPLTERQADVLRSKMTQYDWRTVTVEPLIP